ncbi:MAG: rhomboid family intramembrane serine protease [Cyclobacteriaceae bacterium]|nr:rhomboid family intramembrane serine protease [Cyclobacteriaceae bacterium]
MPVGIIKSEDRKRARDSAFYTFVFLGILWLTKCIEYYSGADFGVFGIYPRTLEGMGGILLSPFIHGDFYHLISNTIPIGVLGFGVIYFYREVAHYVIGLIYLLSGFWVWVAARSAFHIGASGIVYGLLFFLLLSGIIKRDRKQLAVSFVILFLYGGSMFSGLMPLDASVSWEAHVTGAVSGIFCAVLFRKVRFEMKEKESVFSADEERPDNVNTTSGSDIEILITFKKAENNNSNA